MARAASRWKAPSEARRAARTLRRNSTALAGLVVIDGVLPEPRGGAHRDHAAAARILKSALEENLRELETMHPQQRRKERYEKFRRMGVWRENGLTLF